MGKEVPIFGTSQNPVSPCLLLALLCDVFVLSRTRAVTEIQIPGKMDAKTIPGVDFRAREEANSAPPVDVARNLHSHPFSAEELSAYLGREVESYTPLEKGAIRYKQSHACRVEIKLKPGSTASSAKSTPSKSSPFDEAKRPARVKTFFVKRAVIRELPHAIAKANTAPMKLLRDGRANTNEALFLNEFVKNDPEFLSWFSMEKSSSAQLRIYPGYFCEARHCPAHPLDSSGGEK